MSKTPATACDDPRHEGYPCFGRHKSVKSRSNQYAQWTACEKCALRLSYVSKGKMEGAYRQMGPEPHLIRLALEELQQSVPPENCTEKIVNGKLMEVKGKMLQLGVSQTMAIHMTLEEYQKRLQLHGRADHRPLSSGDLPQPNQEGVPTTTPTGYPVNMATLQEENERLRRQVQEQRMTVAAKAKAATVKKEKIEDPKENSRSSASAVAVEPMVVSSEEEAVEVVESVKKPEDPAKKK